MSVSHKIMPYLSYLCFFFPCYQTQERIKNSFSFTFPTLRCQPFFSIFQPFNQNSAEPKGNINSFVHTVFINVCLPVYFYYFSLLEGKDTKHSGPLDLFPFLHLLFQMIKTPNSFQLKKAKGQYRQAIHDTGKNESSQVYATV